ncbi:MAG TPA: sugar-binding protein [Chthoniobacteraceae bacterium]|nr:sugar-binding protein [Chthoniobacteraceae bacterium]
MIKSLHPAFRQTALTLLLVLGVCGKAAGESYPTMGLLRQAPEVDGIVGSEEWQGSLDLGELAAPSGGEPLPPTRVRVGRDDATLYLAVVCGEPLPGQIRTVTIADQRDGPVWQDDSVEIFLDIGHNGRSLFHIAANSAGTLYDAQILDSRRSSAWESGARVQTRIDKTSWSIEIAIPMQALGHRLVRGELFSLNVARNRYAGSAGQKAGVASLAGGRFAFPKYFVPILVEGPIVSGGLSVVSTRRGPFFPNEAGTWEFEVTQDQPQTADVEFHFSSAPGSRAVPESIDTQRKWIAIPFEKGEAEAMRICTLAVKGGEVFRSEYEMQEAALPDRVAKTHQPLFEPLVEPRPDGLAKEGVLLWPHEIVRPFRKALPFRVGAEFEPDDPYRQYARDRAILVGRTGLEREVLEKTREYNIPLAIYLDYRGAIAAGAPKGVSHHRPWKLDPRAIEAYLQDARKAIELSKTYPNIRWLFAGDEQWEIMHRNLLGFLDRKESYPELMAADAEIRKQFGFGKFGLPESASDTDPYRWIATLRWEVAKMISVEKEVRAMIEREAPQMKFLSWDNISGHRPYGLRRWGEVFDVITGQLYPNSNPHRETFGFLTRLAADLSNAKEIWPVPHVEHYAGSYTASEVEELLSQMWRNGASGLHLYSVDVLGERNKEGSSMVERIGAPERWRVVEALAERLENPFVVRQPVADSAIFYSNTSYMGQGTGQGRALNYTNEVEWIYTLLGPRLGAAFRFVDDLLCLDDPAQLQDYKVIYIPYAPIVDDPEYAALESFVKGGGSLIVCDPLAFRHRSDGTPRVEGGLVPPLESLASAAAQRSRFVQEGKTRELRAAGPVYPLRETGETVAHFADGKASAVRVPLGKGNVVFFGANPLVPSVAGDKEWASAFARLHHAAGASLDHEVWRFRFPKTSTPEETRPPGICLTGNYFEWSLSKPVKVANAPVQGSYRLSRTDDRQAEPAHRAISFRKGRLTDRLGGAAAPNLAPPGDFVLRWSGSEATAITFDFEQPVHPARARLFYSDTLPAGVVEVSSDGETWEAKGSWVQAEVRSEEVKLLPVPIASGPCRHVRFTFEPLAENQRLTLVEVDLWSDHPVTH